jgi:hypothetical protein
MRIASTLGRCVSLVTWLLSALAIGFASSQASQLNEEIIQINRGKAARLSAGLTL